MSDRWDVTRETGYKTSGRRLNNPTATTDPTVTDDSSAGYGPMSRWLNTVSGVVWTCSDASVGAAVWSAGGGASDHGGLTGLGDDDHTEYALMVSQASEPADPDRPEALWYDTDEEATGSVHPPGNHIFVSATPPATPAVNDLWLDIS
jgi:hypothetical protein